MRVGQPGVKWEDGYFDGEAQAKSQEKPGLITQRNIDLLNRQNVESVIPGQASVVKIQNEDRDQHQKATDHGVNKELNCRINAILAAPYADDKVHGDEHSFPEHIKQKQIHGDKHTQHPGLQKQHRDHVAL